MVVGIEDERKDDGEEGSADEVGVDVYYISRKVRLLKKNYFFR